MLSTDGVHHFFICPFQPLDPESIAIVSLAASKTLVLTGGPQPWVLDPSRYYQELGAEVPEWINPRHIKGYGATSEDTPSFIMVYDNFH